MTRTFFLLPCLLAIAVLSAGRAAVPAWAAPSAAACDPASPAPVLPLVVATGGATIGAPADSLGPPRETIATPARGDGDPETAPPSADAGHGPVDYLWVLRDALVRPASIDSVVARARAMGVRGLLVQVVGRGDAWYRSAILPRPEALGRAADDFDPLGRLLEEAHAAGLEVHAWMNCMLVWSAPRWPRDPRHVLNEHPEWVTGMRDGRPMSAIGESERRRLAVEGVFLSPAHPRVRAWVASIAKEIAARYPVDGIHLDYIRQPQIAVGYDPTTRARFAMETGVDPDRFDALAPDRRAAMESAWAAFQREQVTAVVRQVRDSLRTLDRPVSLSAAVIADTITAERHDAQCWREWVRSGLLDRVFPMCYAPSVQRVMDQLVALRRDLGAGERVVPGIAVFNTSTSIAALKIKGARALGYPTVALYSYDSLVAGRERWSRLVDRLAPSDSSDPKESTP